MPLLLDRLTAAELQALSRQTTVFFFAVAPLEDFGPHLPMGAGLAEAGRLAWMAAERLERDQPGWTGVCLPPAPLSVTADTTQAAITVRAHVVRDWLVDASLSLWGLGFGQFVCVSGHLGPRQLTAIEEAGKRLRSRTRLARWLSFLRSGGAAPALVSASSALVPPSECARSPLWPDAPEHGGRRDTSVALAVMPEQVRPAYRELVARPREGTRLSRLKERLARARSGYWGEPSSATAEEGAKILEERLGDLMPKLRAVWGGSNPERIFRSWYSIIPPNGSFFKAWLLAIAIGLLLGAWVVWTLQMAVTGGP